MRIFEGKSLINVEPYLVADYLLLIGVIGFGVGVVRDSIIMVAAGAAIFGVYASPLLPVWKRAESDIQRRTILYQHMTNELPVALYKAGIVLFLIVILINVVLLAA